MEHLSPDNWRRSGLSELLLEEGGYVLLKYTIHRDCLNEVSTYVIHKKHFTGDLMTATYRTKNEDEALEQWIKIVGE